MFQLVVAIAVMVSVVVSCPLHYLRLQTYLLMYTCRSTLMFMR